MSLREFSGFGEFNLKLKEPNFISLGMLQLLLRLAENKCCFNMVLHNAVLSIVCPRIIRNTVIFYPFSSLSWEGMKKEG